MCWKIIQTDFSVFQTDTGKGIYSKGEQNKIILLPYANTDLVSVCMVAKKDHLMLSSSPFDPMYVIYDKNDFCETKTFAENLIYSFNYKKMTEIVRKELQQFKLTQKQVPSEVLIKTFNEQPSNKYLDLGFYPWDRKHFFVRQHQVSRFLDYIKFLDKNHILLTSKAKGSEKWQLFLDHSDLLHSKDISAIHDFIKNDTYAFYFASTMVFGASSPEHIKYQLQFIEKIYDNLLDMEKRISPVFKDIWFYYDATAMQYHDTSVIYSLYKIDLLRSLLLSNLSDGCYLSEVVRYRNRISCASLTKSDIKEIMFKIRENIQKYIDNFMHRQPLYIEANKMIFDIYKD